MSEDIRKNLKSALKMLQEIADYKKKMYNALPRDRKMLESAINSLENSLKIINDSISFLIDKETINKPLSNKKPDKDLMTEIAYNYPNGKLEVVLSSSERDRFLKELSISESLISKIKKLGKKNDDNGFQEFQAVRGYLKMANKFFLGTASKLVRGGKFSTLSIDIKRANLNILAETYVATIIFSSVVSFIAGLFLAIFLLFFQISLEWPIVRLFEGGLIIRILSFAWIPVAAPLAVFLMLYLYPSAEKKSLARHIEQELPFAVIHMSSISGSGIEPSKIFQIICLSQEYPYLQREIRKIMNQINIYGYDLISSLSNVARSTPSEKLSELLDGLATTIHSGGDLSDFFKQRAETLLVSYRIEREKYTKVAETFMDIYISVVIATPMILILLLIMISVSGIQVGFSPVQMSLIIIVIVALVNIIFLGVLHVKQPNY